MKVLTNVLNKVSEIVYKVAIYIRLSKEDEKDDKEKDSESVTNQRNILLKFVKDNGYELIPELYSRFDSCSCFYVPYYLVWYKKLIIDSQIYQAQDKKIMKTQRLH